MNPWSRWVAWVGRDADAGPIAAVRVLACVAIVCDLLEVARLRLVPVLFRTYDAGGLSVVQDDAGFLIAASPAHGGPIAWGVAVGALLLAALGVWTRPALVLGLLAYAQLGHLYPPGDRAIDRLLRTVLLILLFSGAHRRLALTGPRQDRIAAWPADLIKGLLVLVYLSAGIAKLQQQPGWISWPELPVLYRVMADPLSAHLDPVAALAWAPAFRVLGFGTIALELSSPLLLTRLAPYWALCGVAMHIGIAMTMELGMFSWGMLALYPILLAPLLPARIGGKRGAA